MHTHLNRLETLFSGCAMNQYGAFPEAWLDGHANEACLSAALDLGRQFIPLDEFRKILLKFGAKPVDCASFNYSWQPLTRLERNYQASNLRFFQDIYYVYVHLDRESPAFLYEQLCSDVPDFKHYAQYELTARVKGSLNHSAAPTLDVIEGIEFACKDAGYTQDDIKTAVEWYVERHAHLLPIGASAPSVSILKRSPIQRWPSRVPVANHCVELRH